MGPLQALAKTYDDRLLWTMQLPHLGVPGCVRHHFRAADLPKAELNDIGSKTKEPNVLCVEAVSDDGEIILVQLLSPCSYGRGEKLTKELVRSGVHPLDIIIATLNLDTIKDDDPEWKFRNSVEWMFWNHEDQRRLDIEVREMKV